LFATYYIYERACFITSQPAAQVFFLRLGIISLGDINISIFFQFTLHFILLLFFSLPPMDRGRRNTNNSSSKKTNDTHSSHRQHREDELERRKSMSLVNLSEWYAECGYVSGENTSLTRCDRFADLIHPTEFFSKMSGHRVLGVGVEGYALYVSRVFPDNYYGKWHSRDEHALKVRELNAPMRDPNNAAMAAAAMAEDAVGNVADIVAVEQLNSIARELFVGHVLAADDAPFVASLIDWQLFNGGRYGTAIPPNQKAGVLGTSDFFKEPWPSVNMQATLWSMYDAGRFAALAHNKNVSMGSFINKLAAHDNYPPLVNFEFTDYLQPEGTALEVRFRWARAMVSHYKMKRQFHAFVEIRPSPPNSSARAAILHRTLLANRHLINGAYAYFRLFEMKRVLDASGRQRPLVLIKQKFGGETTLHDSMNEEKQHNRMMLSTAKWPLLRARIAVLCHMLYTLQKRYGFVHGDLHTNNITLTSMDAETMRSKAPAYATGVMWLLRKGRRVSDGQWETRTEDIDFVSDLDSTTLTLIDFGLASVDKENATVRDVMKRDAKHFLNDVSMQSLINACGNYRYVTSRSTDLRRLALYLAMTIPKSIRAVLETLPTPFTKRRLFLELSAIFDMNALQTIEFMAVPPRHWYINVSEDYKSQKLSPSGRDIRKSDTIGEFLSYYRSLEVYLYTVRKAVEHGNRYRSVIVVDDNNDGSNNNNNNDGSDRVFMMMRDDLVHHAMLSTIHRITYDLNPATREIGVHHAKARQSKLDAVLDKQQQQQHASRPQGEYPPPPTSSRQFMHDTSDEHVRPEYVLRWESMIA
jgi:hypothetical protein